MKFLHTSDWHLGRSLYGRKRYDEFTAFLNWLSNTIQEESVDTLLVAGDVFDTSTPSNRAQELYYRFLCRVSASCCQHVVIIGGNHDSPSFLNAPKELLRALNVFVVGAMAENLKDEILVLEDVNNLPQAIVCAVPYLRDKDIRTAEPGETIDHKNAKLIEGLKNHYVNVCAIADKKRAEFENLGYTGIPIVGMGHLFTAGGKTSEGDGVRELYVGSLAHVGQDVFPISIDYFALGHLHVPQFVGNAEHIRYSGSPIPMGYGEATQDKKVVLMEFTGKTPHIREITIPCFQPLARIAGSLDEIITKVNELKEKESQAWLEIEYTGRNIIGNLRKLVEEALAESALEVRRIKNKRVMERLMSAIEEASPLDDLDISDVFTRCLDAYEVPTEDRDELTISYNEIIQSLNEDDLNVD